MGLDLVLYTAKKWTDEGEELAYGRKTWAIESFFERRCKMVKEDYYVFEITKDAWDEFIERLSPYMKNKAFKTMIKTYNEFDEDATYEVEALIEEFLDKALDSDSCYQLGPAWEAYAVVKWYEADAEVRACFDENMPVWMLASF